jgi:hypothetical protein
MVGDDAVGAEGFGSASTTTGIQDGLRDDARAKAASKRSGRARSGAQDYIPIPTAALCLRHTISANGTFRTARNPMPRADFS